MPFISAYLTPHGMQIIPGLEKLYNENFRPLHEAMLKLREEIQKDDPELLVLLTPHGLALDEALNNAMEHGNKLNPDKKVKIECHISKAKFTIKVQDEGKGFDVNNLPNPFANISRSRGRGIFICKNIMDEIHFTNNDSEITIVKYNPLFSNSNNK